VAVAKTTEATKILQTFNVHLYFTAQITFNSQLADLSSKRIQLFFR
jgi:hypothetical protein